MIISTDAEKPFDKNHTLSHKKKKKLSKLATEGNFLNLVKKMQKKLKLTSQLMVGNLKCSY